MLTLTFAARELLHFVRQPARTAAAVGTPLLLWLLLSSGLGRLASELGADYGAFLVPGAMTLVAVFAAIFSSISLIDDRNNGWMQAVLVSPAPRWSIALGKALGGAATAWAQGMLLLPLLPLSGVDLSWSAVALSALALAITCIGVSALGLAFAWRSETAASFHAVMNLVFLPLWLLSSAMFPLDGAAPWLAWLMRINPMTWCTEAVRAPLLGEAWATPLAASAVFAVAMVGVAVGVMGRGTQT